MRVLLALALLAFLSGCLSPQTTGDTGSPIPTSEPERSQAVLGTYSGPPPGNINVQVSVIGGGIGFEVNVPPGGATNVLWTLETPGSTVSNLSWIEGPGCTHQGPNEIGQTGVGNSLHGKCGDLEAGPQRFAVHSPGGSQTGFTATIQGDILG